MAEKSISIAVSWAAACGGCDVSLLDIEEPLLELAAIADIVYWPVAMDFKRDEFVAREPGSVDIGLFNGAIRTSEQAEDALAFRDKCKVLVAYGSCACFGGIPGLGNLAQRQELLDVAYQSTPSTDNPEGVRPQTRTEVPAGELELPSFLHSTRSLAQVVDVDVLLPGCPPPTERVLDLVAAAKAFAADGSLPPKGAVIADDKPLCDSCPRAERRGPGRIVAFHRRHQLPSDSGECFLRQGVVCSGIATRGGCGASCISVNMPCRGCFGPTEAALDPAAEALSAIGSIAGEANENHAPAHLMKKAVRSIADPAGTFYRFTLPSAFLHRAVSDKPDQ